LEAGGVNFWGVFFVGSRGVSNGASRPAQKKHRQHVSWAAPGKRVGLFRRSSREGLTEWGCKDHKTATPSWPDTGVLR